MKRSWVLGLSLLAFCFVGTALLAQSSDSDHIEVGVFADYFNLARTTPHTNFVGVGGRAAFNVRSTVQIEAEMAYDFERNFTTITNNGITSNFVTVGLRPLHVLFGPKIQSGGGAFRVFGTFKAGLINFSATNKTGTAGFQNGLSDVTTGNTSAAIYPGAGVEGFLGPIGLRADVGDEIYFNNGTHNNLRVTFGF